VNLSVPDGICNGTVLQLHSINAQTLTVKDKQGISWELPRMVFDIKAARPLDAISSSQIYAHRIQYPVVPATSLTINKSQGTTQPTTLPPPGASPFPPVLLDFTRPGNSHGSDFVSFSRVRDPSHLAVVVNDCDIDSNGVAWIRNVVFRNLLRQAQLLPELSDEPAQQNRRIASPEPEQARHDAEEP
jgi:hypothetical protein